MARRSDHSREHLKDMALNAAIRIVETEGFEKLTARRLAGEIGYTPGTLYNIFGSMDGLYYAINALTLETLLNTLAKAGLKTADAQESLMEMAGAYIGFAHKNTHLWLMLFNAPLTGSPPDWYAEKIESVFIPLEKALLSLYDENTPKQEITLAARTLWAAVHGICYLEITQKGPLTSTRKKTLEMASYLIRHLINGISRG